MLGRRDFEEDAGKLVYYYNACFLSDIGELLCNDAVVAFVNGRPWDMHRPLQESCEIRMQMFRDENPHVANRALWRTGSFLLSYMAERVLKDEYFVEVHSWPPPDIRTGSYVCDVDLKIPEWSPRTDELLVMNKVIARIISQRVQFERLDVPAETALQMFEDNRFKREQIPNIAEKFADRPGFVPVYRLLDHVDISGGPLISHTGQIGRHQLTAVHQIDCKGIGSLYRLQGIALPVTQALNFYTWNILLQRAKNLVSLPLLLSFCLPRVISFDSYVFLFCLFTERLSYTWRIWALAGR